MARVLMLIGIQGSGKTTYSKDVLLKENPNAIILSSDGIRNLNPTMEEKLVFPTMYDMCANYLKNNIDVIYDATNITKVVRKRFFEQMKLRNVENLNVIAYVFERNLALSIKRVKIRNTKENERFLPIEVIEKYDASFEDVTLDEGFIKIIRVNTFIHNEKDF